MLVVSVQQGAEVGAVDALGCEVVKRIGAADLVDGDHVSVFQGGDAEKLVHRDVLRAVREVDCFDDDPPRGAGVFCDAREMGSTAWGAEWPEQRVASDRLRDDMGAECDVGASGAEWASNAGGREDVRGGVRHRAKREAEPLLARLKHGDDRLVNSLKRMRVETRVKALRECLAYA